MHAAPHRWSLSIASRFGATAPDLGYVSYSLVVQLQGSGQDGSAQLTSEITNSTLTPIERGYNGQPPQTAYASDWSYFL